MTRNVSITLPGRIVYVSGMVNGAAYVFTRIDGKWSATVSRSGDDVYRLSMEATADDGTVGRYSTTVYYGAQLVTDRTAQDVANGTAKGFYNASDLNRVGYATKFLADRILGMGYSTDIAPKVDWLMEDIPTRGQMNRYLRDVNALQNALRSDVEIPQTMELLDWQGANSIELALARVGINADNMQAAYFYSGEIYGGEV